MSETIVVEEREVVSESRPIQANQHGGLKALPFIFVYEICDRFSGTGVFGNMMMYLTKQLNLPFVMASNILVIFGGVSGLTPLLGALVADSLVGRFWIIAMGSIIYELGVMGIFMSAVLPSLRPAPCPSRQYCQEASGIQVWTIYTSLVLTSLGTGGLRPCVTTFAADQFDMSRSAVNSRGWNFFNLYFFGGGLASLIAQTLIVYIQDNYGWVWGFSIPTVAWMVAIFVFLMGSPMYRKVRPRGSPLVRIAQVLCAAFKKRRLMLPPRDSCLLYQNHELDASISANGILVHTPQFSCLDKAAIVTEEERSSLRNPNLWRLSTVHRVEELKTIVRMLPIWSAGVLTVAATSHIGHFTNIQASSMNRDLGHIKISPANMQVFGTVGFVICLVAYERAFVPLARKFTGNPAGISPLQRIGIGFVIQIVSTLVSALVETKRKAVAADHHLLDSPTAAVPMSIFWLVPQYLIHGVGNAFVIVGNSEFMYDQSPETVRSTTQGLFGVVLSIGSFLGTALVKIVNRLSGPDNMWLTPNINSSHLDKFYYLAAAIQAINVIYFAIVAWLYVYKPLDEAAHEETESRVEAASTDDG